MRRETRLIVCDASALIDVLPGEPAALACEYRHFSGGQSLHAPHLIDAEVSQVVRRYAAIGKIDGEIPVVCARGDGKQQIISGNHPRHFVLTADIRMGCKGIARNPAKLS